MTSLLQISRYLCCLPQCDCQINDNIYSHFVFKHLFLMMSFIHYNVVILFGKFACYLAGLTTLPTLVKTQPTGFFKGMPNIKHSSHTGGLQHLSYKASWYCSGCELTCFTYFQPPSATDICEDCSILPCFTEGNYLICFCWLLRSLF